MGIFGGCGSNPADTRCGLSMGVVAFRLLHFREGLAEYKKILYFYSFYKTLYGPRFAFIALLWCKCFQKARVEMIISKYPPGYTHAIPGPEQ
jgi:hypothetical protein